MRRGSCTPGVDGSCEEASNELGQCSAPYHDCHLTGCCQRGEDHCFLKNEFYGQCRPTCSKAELGDDWSCERRELPTEQNKMTCETLRTRNNIFKRPCSTQYDTAGLCNQAFSSQNNVYQPCVWQPSSSSCKESGQTLACDCALMGNNCPSHAHNVAAASSSDEDSSGEGVVVVIAILIIICGCGGLAWFFLLAKPSASRMTEQADDDRDDGDDGDGDEVEEVTTKKRKKKKDKLSYDRAVDELDSVDL